MKIKMLIQLSRQSCDKFIHYQVIQRIDRQISNLKYYIHLYKEKNMNNIENYTYLSTKRNRTLKFKFYVYLNRNTRENQ